LLRKPAAMYRLDWIEQLKLGKIEFPAAREIAAVSPTVWKLGWTSLLTDISTEMVNSVIPIYIVLHLHMTPLQYGAIDGIYNGFALALLSLSASLIADRKNCHKEAAAAGYGISAICKLALLCVGGMWSWIAGVIALDRLGKGIRTAPRDALISLNTHREYLGTAFSVHRALDAGGMLLGPIAAFLLLWVVPAAYDVVWLTSFVVAVIGLSVLWLFVPNPDRKGWTSDHAVSLASALRLFRCKRFSALTGCGLLLSLATMSDGFIYLLLQQKSGAASVFFPLFYVLTACFYMLFSVPAGRLADKWGRARVLLSGYGVLGLVYLALQTLSSANSTIQVICLAMMGAYYAATEGVLMAMASAVVPPALRTSGLAMLATAVGLGKMGSSLLFGWVWEVFGAQTALAHFSIALVAALAGAGIWLRVTRN
jgi:MFS family permease